MSQHFVINAGRKKIGDVGYDNYVGQIDPADMTKIIWYGANGNDGTGDGSFANPYLTFARATDDLTTTKFYVLETSLNGRYALTNKIYYDPTRPDDTGNGLTSATAKKTFPAAKVAAISNGFTVIEALGSFVASEFFDFNVQGQIGFTLTLNLGNMFYGGFTQHNTSGKITSVCYGVGKFVGTSDTAQIARSADGLTWTTSTIIANSLNMGGVTIGYPSGSPLFIACGKNFNTNDAFTATSIDGISWTYIIFTANFYLQTVYWDGSQYIMLGNDGTNQYLYTSPDGLAWTNRTIPFTTLASGFMQIVQAGGGLIIAGGDKKLMSSPDGITWTDRSALLPAGAYSIYDIDYGSGRFIIGTTAGLQESSDPTASITTIPGITYVRGLAYSPSTNSFIIHGFNGGNEAMFALSASNVVSTLYIFSFSGTSDLRAHSVAVATLITGDRAVAAGHPVTKVVTGDISYSATVGNLVNAFFAAAMNPIQNSNTVYRNLNSVPATGKALKSAYGCVIENCSLRSPDDDSVSASTNVIKVRQSILKAPATKQALLITGTTAVQDDIEVSRNTIDANFSLVNTGGTNKELVQDNIITGDAVATAVTDMKSGDVLGAVSNFNLLPTVAQIDPLFIDSVEYKIQRELLGAIFDSYMIQRSAFYLNGNGDAADWGAWSSFAVNVEYIFTRSFNFLLPSKTDTVGQVKHNRANLKVSENGTPDVVNTPTGRWEELTLNYGALPQLADYLANHIEFIDWMESLIDMTCEIALDANYAPATAVVASAASAIDDPLIDIVAANIRSGDRIVVGTNEYSVIYVINGTRLVLSEPLKSAVSISQSIRVKSPIGYGQYQYVPQQERKLTQWLFNRKDYVRGLQLRFVRKWQ